MKTRVAVLMATYNGAPYLEEQLQSILEQTYRHWDLYVQDDLSQDGTPQLLQKYAALDSRIHVLHTADKLGAKGNFIDLMCKVEADCYFFADQDDVWLPEKMQSALSELKRQETEHPGKPVIVHSDLTVVDRNLNEIAPSLWKMLRIAPELLHTFDSLAAHCLLTGCTMLFNRKVRDLSLPMPGEALMHDAWMALVTLRNGGIISEVAQPTILYRQHGRNTIGAKDYRKDYLYKKVCNALDTYHHQRNYYRMLRKAGYGSIFKFYKEKIKYYFAYRRKHKQNKSL